MTQEPISLSGLLEAIRPASDSRSVSVAQLLERIGGRSFAPVILIPALILVSPLSAIPGSPTIGMLLIVTVSLQALLGRQHLWLPKLVTRRQIPSARLSRALDWLARPVAFIDRHSRDRWRALTTAPLDRLPLLAICAIALPWPVLEPLPMVTSVGAFAVSLFAIGLMLRDGLYVIAGFGFCGVLVAGLMALWQGVI